MKDSARVEAMVSEKYGCVGLFRGWKRMIQDLDLEDSNALGIYTMRNAGGKYRN